MKNNFNNFLFDTKSFDIISLSYLFNKSSSNSLNCDLFLQIFISFLTLHQFSMNFIEFSFIYLLKLIFLYYYQNYFFHHHLNKTQEKNRFFIESKYFVFGKNLMNKKKYKNKETEFWTRRNISSHLIVFNIIILHLLCHYVATQSKYINSILKFCDSVAIVATQSSTF